MKTVKFDDNKIFIDGREISSRDIKARSNFHKYQALLFFFIGDILTVFLGILAMEISVKYFKITPLYAEVTAIIIAIICTVFIIYHIILWTDYRKIYKDYVQYISKSNK